MTDNGQARDPAVVPITFVNDEPGIRELAEAIEASVRVAADSETEFREEMDVDGIPGRARVLSFCTRDRDGVERAWVVDLRDVDPAGLRNVLQSARVDGWNANFDERVFETVGLRVGLWYDGMLADAVLHAGVPGFGWWHGLAWAAKHYVGIPNLDGKGSVQLSYNTVDDLSEDQIRYAAVDAVVTLWVCDELARHADKVGLSATVEREVRARRFINKMMKHGIPYDMDEWLAYVDKHHRVPRDEIAAQIAVLTGGGQGTLFSEEVEATWNLGSATQVGAKLNEVCPDEVRAALGGKLFEPKVDSVDDSTLNKIDHEFARLILKWRAHEKVVSTYGPNMLAFWSDGRLRSRYKQGLVDTGRLASDKPNAQNFDKGMKSRARTRRGRVIVYGDLSQAELRVGADTSQEEGMISSFKAGEDLHKATASRMSGIDVPGDMGREKHWIEFHDWALDQLRQANPDKVGDLPAGDGDAPWADGDFWKAAPDELAARLRDLGVAVSDDKVIEAAGHRDAAATAAVWRQAAKAINFGILYGLGAARLADQLTENGAPTSFDEAKELLNAYLEAYPSMAEWLSSRDASVEAFASNPPEIDWDATFSLYRLHKLCNPTLNPLTKKLGRKPDPDEIAREAWPEMEVVSWLTDRLGHDPSPQEMDEEWERRTRLVAWWREFPLPVVLGVDGNPISFESRTKSGRRRLFQLQTEHVLEAAATRIVNNDHPAVRSAVFEFSKSYRSAKGGRVSFFVSTEDGWKPKSRAHLKKIFEDRQLRWDLVRHILDLFPASSDKLLRRTAVAEVARAMKNQFRNQPIQGGVADAMEDAFAVLDAKLDSEYVDAYPIQSVHDSVSLECNIEDAERLCRDLRAALQSALERIYPSVPAVADCDVRVSLSDDDVVATFDGDSLVWKVPMEELAAQQPAA